MTDPLFGRFGLAPRHPHRLCAGGGGGAAADGDLRRDRPRMRSSLYHRWFEETPANGKRLDLPMNPHLAEMFRGLGQPD